jgi:hypothetical protein
MAAAIRKIRGSKDTSLGDPLSWPDQVPANLFLCHADAPSSGFIGWKQCVNPRRKSEIRIIDLRRRNAYERRITPSLELAVIRREARDS